MSETLAHGYLRVLSESFPMNTNMTALEGLKVNWCKIIDGGSLNLRDLSYQEILCTSSWKLIAGWRFRYHQDNLAMLEET